jgi:hypothetical protein
VENIMDNVHQDAPDERPDSRWKWALAGFLAVAAFFLWAEHRAHLFGALPYLLILACPLMHIFHHGGHGHAHHRQDGTGGADAQRQVPNPGERP